MREFFVQCFKDLHDNTGLKQYIDIASDPDKQHAQEKLNKIINAMMRQSGAFEKIIPFERQKEIIEQRILDDQDMFALNAKILYKWLAQEYDRIKRSASEIESGHAETNKLLEEMKEPEPLSPKTQKMIQEWEYELSKGFTNPVKKVVKEEMMSIKRKDKESQEGRKSSGYIPNPELVILHEKRMEWMRKYHDPITGKRMPEWVAFEEYCKMDL